VYLGYIAWTAGSVTSDYILDLAPTLTGTTWVDQKMAVECVINVWSSVTGPAAPTWGLTLGAKGEATPTGAAGAASTSSSSVASTSNKSAAVSTTSSTAVSTSASATTATTLSTGKSGSPSGSQTSAAPSTSQTKAPNSANGVKVASGLMAGSLLLAAMLL
jgi:endoglucanase